jgi:hypothetical protein
MKALLMIVSLLAVSPAFAATIEYTYFEKAVVIANEEVKNKSCEVASCNAYAYYEALKSLDAAVEATCKARGFKKYVIVDTKRNTESTQALVLTMTGLCKK